jgi:HEAT repeat protein
MTRRPSTPGAVLLLFLLLPACTRRPAPRPATGISRSPTTAPTTAPTHLTERTRLNQWLSAPRQWQDLQAVAQLLRDDRPDIRASALIALLNLWETSGGARTLNPIPVGLNADGVIAELADHFTTLPLRYRGTALGIVNALGADRAQAVPLLLYAVADEDDSIQSIAAAMRDRAFRRIEFDRSLLAAYVRFLEQPHAAPRVDDIAMAWFESRKFARLMSSTILLADSASGHEGARGLVRRWFPELTRTLRNADRVGALPPPQRGVFLPLFDALHQGQGQVWVTREVERLLASDDPGVRRLMAKLMTESSTYGPMPLLQASLASGRPVGDAVLKETHLTPALACREIADVIGSPDSTPRTRLAALATLRVIGLHGPEIRPAVEGRLVDPDDAVRYAAAEFLGRTDTMKQCGCPPCSRTSAATAPRSA